jgi:hypothetical protein
MKRKRVLILIGAMIGALSLAKPIFAVLGIGDTVFDPAALEQALKEFALQQLQYTQLIQSYQMIRSQYEQMLWMARQIPVSMAVRYGVPWVSWINSAATNTYGTTGAWVTGANTGIDVSAGYSSATQSLNAYGAALGKIPADQLDRVKINYATVELTDGANQSALTTLGRMRGNAPAVETAIQNLETDSFSSDPAMNTEIAVLNKINAANVINVRSQQDTNKLLAALAEERIIEANRQRDAEAQAINQHIRFMAEAKSVLDAQAANASAEMRAWRMP